VQKNLNASIAFLASSSTLAQPCRTSCIGCSGRVAVGGAQIVMVDSETRKIVLITREGLSQVQLFSRADGSAE
jgi:hypothetical protein